MTEQLVTIRKSGLYHVNRAGRLPLHVVIRDRGEATKSHRYVVHFFTPSNGAYFQGSYCVEFADALQEFQRRVRRESEAQAAYEGEQATELARAARVRAVAHYKAGGDVPEPRKTLFYGMGLPVIHIR